MAYTYTPFDYQRAMAPMYESDMAAYRTGTPSSPNQGYAPNLNQWNQEQNQAQQNAFQGYAGDQFKGLFDMATANQQKNPLQGFAQTPMYSPYGGTRASHTSPIVTTVQDDPEGRAYSKSTGGVFDQQGYLDARFGNINNYLNQMGSFLGNIGGESGVRQDAIERSNYNASLPQVGSSMNMSGVPQVGGLSGFAQAAPGNNYGGWGGRQVSGGWGSHPVAGGLLGFGGE